MNVEIEYIEDAVRCIVEKGAGDYVFLLTEQKIQQSTKSWAYNKLKEKFPVSEISIFGNVGKNKLTISVII